MPSPGRVRLRLMLFILLAFIPSLSPAQDRAEENCRRTEAPGALSLYQQVKKAFYASLGLFYWISPSSSKPADVDIITKPNNSSMPYPTNATVFGYSFDDAQAAPGDLKDPPEYADLRSGIKEYLVKQVFPDYEKKFKVKFVRADSGTPFEARLHIVGIKNIGARGVATLPTWPRGTQYLWMRPDLTDDDIKYIARHELEHSFGLVHVKENLAQAPFDDERKDTVENTLMSYNGRFDNYYMPDTVTTLSAEALDKIVGANEDFNSGDTTHTLTGKRLVGALIDRSGENVLSGEGFSGNSVPDYYKDHTFLEVLKFWKFFPERWSFFNDVCEIQLAPDFDPNRSQNGATVVGGTRLWVQGGSKIQTAKGCSAPTILAAHENSTLIGGSDKKHPTLFKVGKGKTRIKEFNTAKDQIDLGEYAFSTANMVDTGNGTEIFLPNNQSVFINGVSSQNLLDGHFCQSANGTACQSFQMSSGSKALAGIALVGIPALSTVAVGGVAVYLVYKMIHKAYQKCKGSKESKKSCPAPEEERDLEMGQIPGEGQTTQN